MDCVFVGYILTVAVRQLWNKHDHWFCFSTLGGHLRTAIYISRYLWSFGSRIGLKQLLSLWGTRWLWMTSKCKRNFYILTTAIFYWPLLPSIFLPVLLSHLRFWIFSKHSLIQINIIVTFFRTLHTVFLISSTVLCTTIY